MGLGRYSAPVGIVTEAAVQVVPRRAAVGVRSCRAAWPRLSLDRMKPRGISRRYFGVLTILIPAITEALKPSRSEAWKSAALYTTVSRRLTS